VRWEPAVDVSRIATQAIVAGCAVIALLAWGLRG
jgi:hypothetical protein